jgi:hypothetical protein
MTNDVTRMTMAQLEAAKLFPGNREAVAQEQARREAGDGVCQVCHRVCDSVTASGICGNCFYPDVVEYVRSQGGSPCRRCGAFAEPETLCHSCAADDAAEGETT